MNRNQLLELSGHGSIKETDCYCCVYMMMLLLSPVRVAIKRDDSTILVHLPDSYAVRSCHVVYTLQRVPAVEEMLCLYVDARRFTASRYSLGR